jgi:hypothetical protein
MPLRISVPYDFEKRVLQGLLGGDSILVVDCQQALNKIESVPIPEVTSRIWNQAFEAYSSQSDQPCSFCFANLDTIFLSPVKQLLPTHDFRHGIELALIAVAVEDVQFLCKYFQ